MKLMAENETKSFQSEESAVKFFEEIDNAGIWQRCYTNELQAIGLVKAPILIDEIKRKNPFAKEVSDESICESIESVGLSVLVPTTNGFENYPLADTCMSSIMQRAGYGLDSSSLKRTRDQKTKGVMDPEKKALAINYGLEIAGDMSLVYILDEKVRAIHSGDPCDYARLPFSELSKVFKEGLKEQFSEVFYSGSSVDYNYSSIMYVIKDQEVNKRITDVFDHCGISIAGMYTTVRLISSDIGESGANIYPCLQSATRYISIGKPLSLTHKNNHTIMDFKDNVAKVVSMFKESAEKIEELGKITLKHPDGCLLRMAKQCGLSKKYSCERAPEFASLFGHSATFVDAWWELNDIYDKMIAADKIVNPTKQIQLQEAVARVIFSADVSEYDIPFQWE